MKGRERKKERTGESEREKERESKREKEMQKDRKKEEERENQRDGEKFKIKPQPKGEPPRVEKKLAMDRFRGVGIKKKGFDVTSFSLQVRFGCVHLSRGRHDASLSSAREGCTMREIWREN